MDGPNVNLKFITLLQEHIKSVTDNEENYTFQLCSQIDELSNQVGHYFKCQGFKRSDTVALFVEGRPEYVCLWLGLAKIGVVAALINTNLRKNPLIHSITVANSKAIIFSDELSEGVEEVLDSLGGIPLYQFSDANPGKLLPKAVNLSAAISSTPASSLLEDIVIAVPKDKLLYIFTSGTTGMPKAAVITNLRFMFMGVGVHWMLDIGFDDIIYNSLPLYHTAGGMIGVGQVLLHGCSVVIRKKFSASNFWTDCIAYNCTSSSLDWYLATGLVPSSGLLTPPFTAVPLICLFIDSS
uniref:Long-chain-fatty-acid--CoA ligase n=1 Tax=Timema monikensis TaxID=170555 RepID=A0A7R9EIZ7_9NEOP|nr:unnamed protein product [Timema monikensis]